MLGVVWQGNQHNRYFLFDFEEPIRLHDHGDVGAVVPTSMISALWQPSFGEIDAAVASARADRVVLLGTPPPKADEAVRAGLAREPVLLRAIAAAGESADTIPITPAAVRVGLWNILQDDLEAQASRIGAVFVPVPATAQTAEGCLKPEYSLDDATHANGAFGALMFNEMERSLARAEVPSS